MPGLGKGQHKMSLEHLVLTEVTRDSKRWVTRLHAQLDGVPNRRGDDQTELVSTCATCY